MRRAIIGLAAALLSMLLYEMGLAQEERRFANGTIWVPLPTKIETYMVVERGLSRCGSGRWLMISFADRDTAADENAARAAVLDAVEGLAKICKETKNIRVDGYIASEVQPDSNGKISHGKIALSANVSRWSGSPKIALMRNNAALEAQAAEQAAAAAAAQAELEANLAKRREEDERKRQEDEARFAAQRAEFADHIARVRALAEPQGGWLGLFGGGAEERLIGIWSNPDGHCDTDLLVFYVQDGRTISEFWSRAGGLELAPVLQGEWTLKNDIVQLRYTKQLMGGAFTKSVEVKDQEEAGRVRLISADENSVALTAKGVTDPHPLFFFYPEESKLLRCR